MIKNFLKITLRIVTRHKGYSFINIAGLAFGITSCILMLLWVQDEMKWDRFHKNTNNIYRVCTESVQVDKVSHSAHSPNPLKELLRNNYPGIINATRYWGGWGGWDLHYGDKFFNNEKLGSADPSLFEIFDFPFIIGDPKTALKNRSSIVLTDSLAKKCFGDRNPVGEVIHMVEIDMKVTGVVKDIPSQSHIQFDYMFSIENMRDWASEDFDSWKRSRFQTYRLTCVSLVSSSETLVYRKRQYR